MKLVWHRVLALDQVTSVKHLPGCGDVRLPPDFVPLFLHFLITVLFFVKFLPNIKAGDADCDHTALPPSGRRLCLQ